MPSTPITGSRLWMRTDTDFDTSIGQVVYGLNGRRWISGSGGSLDLDGLVLCSLPTAE